MEQKKCRVVINGEEKWYPFGIPYGEIAKEYEKPDACPIVLVMVNGVLRELHKKLKEDAEISFVTTQDEIGHKAYKRSMSLLLLKAIYHIAGHQNVEKVILHYSIQDGFYYTINGNVKLDEAFLTSVKQYMLELVDRQVPIMKRSVSTREARKLFRKYHMYDKEKLFRYRRVSRVNIYSLEEFEDYFYGFMVWHTGYLKYFDLCLYDEGLVLLLPSMKTPVRVAPFEVSEKVFQVQKESEQWGARMGVETVGDLNEKITAQSMQNLILAGEALQEQRIAAIADQIVRTPDKKIILIAGPSSSGKTTFSHRLSVQLEAQGMIPHPIAVDNYFRNREDTPLDEFGKKNFECLEAVDVEKFNSDMNALLRGECVEIPRFNFVEGRREYKKDFLQLGPDDILVIEGIHCLNDALTYSLPKESKYKIYISALTQLNVDEHNRIPTTDGRLIRRMVRDARTRGTSAKETIAMWPSVRRGEDNYIFPYQEEADVMFNSALIYELAVLKVYAEPLLFQITEDDPEYQEAKRLLKFLDYFLGIPAEDIPQNSILREFVGNGCFRI